jgi:hypothetical protein
MLFGAPSHYIFSTLLLFRVRWTQYTNFYSPPLLRHQPRRINKVIDTPHIMTTAAGRDARRVPVPPQPNIHPPEAQVCSAQQWTHCSYWAPQLFEKYLRSMQLY